jgi:hypothetical protein
LRLKKLLPILWNSNAVILSIQIITVKEQFLHFVWQNRRFNPRGLKTICGQEVEVLDPGKLNLTDGPDFLNARIKLGDTIWAGNIEIHVSSSDWIRHRHSKDPRYKNIILHVVYHHDILTDIAGCPTLELTGLIPRSVHDRYLDLMQSSFLLPCAHLLPEVDESTIVIWKERLLIERMEEKVRRLEALHQSLQQDWEQTAFVWFMRYFGTGINADNFQELAMRIPHTRLAKIADEPEQVMALLFGTAGFLQGKFEGDFPRQLQQQYQFLSHKWQIQHMPPEWWRWKHARPATFPSVRLAQLSSSLSLLFPLLHRLLLPTELENLLTGVRPHSYWDHHYRFDVPATERAKPITPEFIINLQINACVPLMIAYGRAYGDENIIERALQLLSTLPAEDNKITRAMEEHGLLNENAFDSQSIMHLKGAYCDKKKCLQCTIGNKILDTRGGSSVHSGLNLVEDECYI